MLWETRCQKKATDVLKSGEHTQPDTPMSSVIQLPHTPALEGFVSELTKIVSSLMNYITMIRNWRLLKLVHPGTLLMYKHVLLRLKNQMIQQTMMKILIGYTKMIHTGCKKLEGKWDQSTYPVLHHMETHPWINLLVCLLISTSFKTEIHHRCYLLIFWIMIDVTAFSYLFSPSSILDGNYRLLQFPNIHLPDDNKAPNLDSYIYLVPT
jgi:hypothetical protein